jgi:hypothetical protein
MKASPNDNVLASDAADQDSIVLDLFIAERKTKPPQTILIASEVQLPPPPSKACDSNCACT